MEIKKEAQENSGTDSERMQRSDRKRSSFFIQTEWISLKRKLVFLIFAIATVFIFGILFLYLYINKNGSAPSEREVFSFPAIEQEEKNNIGKKQKPVTFLEETSAMKKSKSEDWWLNSGGIMKIGEEEFSTNNGALPKDSYWRKLYSKTNPKDTDKGYFPQNIFRLVTRNEWKNYSQSVYFKIDKINLSDSSNRNESNGVLLFNRYQNGKDLYYAGLRVDGDSVIKKKSGGKYHTLAEKNVFSNGRDFNRDENPNLLPLNTWLGIRSQVENNNDGGVNIKFYVDREGKGDWQLVLEIKDNPDKNGSQPFLDKGYAGIRTDFMDVSFKNYDIRKL